MSKLIKRIFLDLDDVLNKFTMPALAHVGCPVDKDSHGNFPTKCGFNIVEAANSFFKSESEHFFDKNEFWSLFGEEFWASLPVSSELSNFIYWSRSAVERRNVYILTSATGVEGCLEGKRRWIIRNLGSKWIRKLITCKDKFVCAADSLLIDDSQKNVDEFIEAGGSAITVPRPWNPLWGKVASTHVKSEIAKAMEASPWV